jgi:hypothetical protein
MIEVSASLYRDGERRVTHLEGALANASGLKAVSGYQADFDGRDSVLLRDYPRWSESVRALVARCIAIGSPSAAVTLAPDRWSAVQICIGIRGGGRGNLRPIAMVQMAAGIEYLEIGWVEGRLSGFCDSIPIRNNCTDAWQLVQLALSVSVFGSDYIPEVRPLDVKFYSHGNIPYVRTSELPEPVRSAFEARQARSARPVISGAADACYSWDWDDFLNGQR